MSSCVSVVHPQTPPILSESKAMNSPFSGVADRPSSPLQSPVTLSRKLRHPKLATSIPGPYRHSGNNIVNLSKKKQVLKTSFDSDQTDEVRAYMATQMLKLSRLSHSVHTAKMHYQRLRMQELDMMKTVMQDELDLTQASLCQSKHQIGQIGQELQSSGGKVKMLSGVTREQRSCSIEPPPYDRCADDEFPCPYSESLADSGQKYTTSRRGSLSRFVCASSSSMYPPNDH